MTRVNRLLNDNIWDTLCDDEECGFFKAELRPEIRKALLKIAYDFLSFLDAKLPFSDITITGSMANYNYTKYSDIDLHIIFDFSSVLEDKTLLKDLFNAKRRIWNEEHDIMIKGHDVELYAQDAAEPHHSTGVFSVLKNRWNVTPLRSAPDIDEELVVKKSKDIASRIDFLNKIENTYALM